MRIIGIDLGSICCGYGIVEVSQVTHHELGSRDYESKASSFNSQLHYITSGEIRMSKRDTLPMRLKILYDAINDIIRKYKPSHLCLEKIFYHKSIQSAFTLGSTRGVTMLLSAKNAIPVFEYSATELKMALTGYGRAEKQQVKDMVIRILNLDPKSNPSISSRQNFKLSLDVADALALCICHINNYMGYNQR